MPILFFTNISSATVLQTVGEHTQSTVSDAFDSEGLWILGVGSAATMLAHQFDAQTRDSWKDHRYMDPSVTKVGEFWGNGLPEAAILSTQLYFDKDKAIPGIEGILIGSLTVQGLKYSVHRERPNRQEDVSFPSGHTQASFSLASSMTKSYGLEKTWPLWLTAAFTGLTRIADDKHWLSDVTAGATIGVLFGRAGFNHHSGITPTVLFHDSHADGLLLSYQMQW